MRQRGVWRTTAIRAAAPLALCLFGITGCELGYLITQGTGELGILWRAEDLDEFVAEETAVGGGTSTPQRDERRRKLALLGDIKRFAEKELGLDVDDAYSTYHEVEGAAISYVVSAAHPLALVPYRWSYPIVGSVTYKGFFDEDDARVEEARLAKAGWDTHVGSVAAFSTLGWFRDPVLSTMLDDDDGDLAELVFHELVHRTVYFQDRTAVNESLATVVGRAGARRFLVERFGSNSKGLQRYETGLRRSRLLKDARRRQRSDLESLYRSDLAESEKYRRKAELFDHAAQTLVRLQLLREPSQLSRSNAWILAHGQYDVYVPLFEETLRTFGGETAQLMAFLEELTASKDPIPVIQARIEEFLSQQG